MRNSICIGIIGNYFGHLSGAENVEEHRLPNGIFVIDKGKPGMLTASSQAKYPDEGTNVDIEPEFVIRFSADYSNGRLDSLIATHITIGNDYTIRSLEGSSKISQRKAWGDKSKGIHSLWWEIDQFTADNYGENLSLISFIERSGEFYCTTPIATCADTKVFCNDLIEWVIVQVNHQKDKGMYEEILPVLAASGYPQEIILYTGAPNYSRWGEENFVQRGDKVHITAFKNSCLTRESARQQFVDNRAANSSEVLSFSQLVV